ncbi:L,D-transpeptidase [Cyanobium sp. CH-040]|uniref:L,D-transpeptidase n=1 Tax=Cyanobium sp. CH-040 TaxID=2823708 RepID=UPI0020CBF6B8|nr:L,D-transpeptidase [Cyanobium sp. CH-040]MCP9928106.1 L,D-transpeptidase [Cyanobium sp. CH-040]
MARRTFRLQPRLTPLMALLLGSALMAAGPAGHAADEPAGAGAETAAAPAPPAVLSREIVLELGRRQISLVEEGKVLGSWPVAIGDPRTPTPTGRFVVENKVLNPIYQSTSSGKVNNKVGPQAPLGDRWIGFKQSGLNQYGIHGTPDAWSWTVTSRAAVSNGCVRMLTPHVRQLFDQVEVGTPVIVRP